jgi:BCD family chlorophyll transporter-like MFS transporter
VQTALGAIVVLTTSTLNRVMVVELALPAMLPGVLVALHYMVQICGHDWATVRTSADVARPGSSVAWRAGGGGTAGRHRHGLDGIERDRPASRLRSRPS